jgi:hypothetical protein
MGIEPHIWGPSLWASIHLICLGAPEVFKGEQLSYRKFFDALPYVIPCDKCRQHLIENLEKHPMDVSAMSGGKALFAWSVELHNIVNRSLGKPVMSLEDALAKWSSFTPASCIDTYKKEKEDEKRIASPPIGARLLMSFMMVVLGMIIGMLASRAF